jgi:hypothetical protein
MMTTQNRSAASPAALDATHGRRFSRVKGLVGTYLGLSAATIVAVVLLRDNTAMVNSAVWIRSTIVLASALLTLSFVVRAARGSRRAFLRLRIVSTVMVIAIATIIALPGTFPTWLKIEQGCCGLLLLGVVALVNGRALRSAFAAE